MYVGTSNKNAASSLRERLARKKADPVDAVEAPGEAKADDCKKEDAKQEEGSVAEAAAANGEAKTEDLKAEADAKGGDDETGQGVLLGKRALENDSSAGDKASKLPSGTEKMSEDGEGEEPPVKRVSGAKGGDDTVMQLWSELTDKPNAEEEAQAEAEAIGAPNGDAAKAEVRCRFPRVRGLLVR